MEIIDVRNELKPDIQKYVASLPLKITDNTTYLLFTDELKNIKSRLKVIDDRLDKPREKARSAWQEWVDLIKELKAPLLEKEVFCKREMAAYVSEQERIRREEEDRLREIARKQEEERRLKEAVAAEQAGNKAEAEAIIEAPIEPPPVVVPKSVPKVAGVSFTKHWKFRITDPTKIPREYLMPDEAAIGQVVRGLKDKANIPGVEIYSVDGVSGRAAA